MKNMITKTVFTMGLLALSASALADHHGEDEEKSKTIIGYDTSEGARADVYAGSVSNIMNWESYMKAHNQHDLKAICAANADEFKLWNAEGVVIESTDDQIARLQDWFDNSNPQWAHLYSMANEFTDEDGVLQQYVTTAWERTETIEGAVTKVQEVSDVLIENEKIKTFYIAERAILTGD
ncbi:hypothetical protein N9C14_00460 [Gammaproteobacteria bacterium]|nr:hypothetical protein [Gammaproteobacteria bacterium]